MQPGATINPGQPTKDEDQQKADATISAAPEQQTAPPGPATVPPEPKDQEAPEQAPEPQETAGWKFTQAAATASNAPLQIPAQPVSWTASEYVAHHKGPLWYMFVLVVTMLITALVYVVTRDVVSSVVVGIVGVTFGGFAIRKPQVLQYSVDNAGLRIGQKFYPYRLFKSFSILEENQERSILLMPMQRFNLPVSIYYNPQDEPEIIQVLGTHLPHEDRQPTAIDRLMSKIHF